MTFSKKQSKSQPSRHPKEGKPLFIGAKAFVRSAKEGAPFVIYAAPTNIAKSSTASIPEQYKDFEDMF